MMDLSGLQSIIEVSIGFCIAYLALERFRYTKLIEIRFLKTINKAKDLLQQTTDKQDALLTIINKKHKKFKEKSLGSFIFCKMFYDGWLEYGADQWVVFTNAVLLVLSLYFTAIAPVYSYTSLFSFCLISTLALIGILLPTILVFEGNRCSKEIFQELDEYSNVLNSEYDEYDKKIDRDKKSLEE